jgi:hypothetical protein
MHYIVMHFMLIDSFDGAHSRLLNFNYVRQNHSF